MLKALAAGVVILFSVFVATATAHENGHSAEAKTNEAKTDLPLLKRGEADFEAAEKLFRTAGGYGCVACHGQFAQGGGNVGGNIRNHSLSQINYALKNEPTMQLLDQALSPDDKLLLARYLKTLGQFRLIEWTVQGDHSYTQTAVEKGAVSQLVIFNKTFEPLTISLEPIRPGAEISVGPYVTESLIWIPKAGSIRLQYKQNILDIDIK